MKKKKKWAKIVLTDGGVEADITCICGSTFQVSVWGQLYERTKEGMIIKPREYTKDTTKCKCGREYIFITVPDLAYKILNEADFKKVSKVKKEKKRMEKKSNENCIRS